MIKPLANNKVRHLLRMIIALMVAFMVSYYFSLTASPWLIVATFFVMLTPTGSALYQGLLRFFVLAGVVIIVSLFSISECTLVTRMDTIIIGALIGITTNVAILPDRVDVEFRRALIPVLRAFAHYFSGIMELLVLGRHEKADEGKMQVEKCLQALPGWVYEAGFDISMQKGHRYFFMKMSHVGEILFALHYLARQTFSEIFLEKTGDMFSECVVKVDKFFLALITVLELQKISEGLDDFEEEILLIEKDFKQRVPLTLELLDVQKEFVYFAELIYGLKDLRHALIKLAKALR